MQPQFTALLATASGHSIIMENIFESRDAHVYELVKMGADIEVFNSNRFHIKGVSRLQGATVSAKDLRGGAALILAGLAADGQTTIEGFSYVERGYENIISDLQSLGADIHYAAK
jgi:UDP-N-acetylglucosamine 1-carboxyvinyltransferase